MRFRAREPTVLTEALVERIGVQAGAGVYRRPASIQGAVLPSELARDDLGRELLAWGPQSVTYIPIRYQPRITRWCDNQRSAMLMV